MLSYLSKYNKSSTQTIIMKKSTLPIFTVLVIFQLVCIFESKSQTIDKPVNKIYLSLGAGATTENGALVDIGLQASFKNNWIGTLSYSKLEMNPKNIPSDYEQGYTVIIVVPLPDEYPYVDLKIISFSGGNDLKQGGKPGLPRKQVCRLLVGKTLHSPNSLSGAMNSIQLPIIV